jgi:nitrile hydratase accessory protein
MEPLKPEELRQLGVPKNDTAPVFAAPWEATAFAMVLSLHRGGHFDWREWVELLSHEIGAGEPDQTGKHYYERWTHALEKLVAELGLLTAEEIDARSKAWRAAYLATPHGKEVKLSNA